MKVPEKVIQLISNYKHFGDIEKIVETTSFSRYQIAKVLNGEESSDPEAIEAVIHYYEARKEAMSDYSPL